MRTRPYATTPTPTQMMIAPRAISNPGVILNLDKERLPTIWGDPNNFPGGKSDHRADLGSKQ